MFEDYGKFKRVVVTGPQRGGTRICAKMIAKDTGFRYVDEDEFKFDFVRKFFEILKEERIVIQCPTMSSLVWAMDEEGTAIVFMRRNLRDILKSQDRVTFPDGQNWTQKFAPYEMMKYGVPSGVSADVKLRAWETQKRFLKKARPFDVVYGSLKEHPLWSDKHETFKWNQTEDYTI
jgi:hypothetical protein